MSALQLVTNSKKTKKPISTPDLTHNLKVLEEYCRDLKSFIFYLLRANVSQDVMCQDTTKTDLLYYIDDTVENMRASLEKLRGEL